MTDIVFYSTYEPDPLGMEDGETCNRYPEPDEDQPRNWKPRHCKGVMVYWGRNGITECDTCNGTDHD